MREIDRARVVMEQRDPGAKVRGPQRFYELFREVEEGYPFGTWVSILEFSGRSQAYVVSRKIRRGEYKVPGGIRCWEMRVVCDPPTREAKTSELLVRRKG